MKHVLTGCAGCSLLLLLLSGCGPELAQTQMGAEEEQWQTQIRASYSSWQPPRSAPPATFDNRAADYKPAAQPADDAELTVEKADAAPAAPAPDTVGIPTDLNVLNVDSTCAKQTFRATKDIRDKYVLSRLAWDLGILDELCELL